MPGGFYHATLRGNHREPLFRVPSDRRELDSIVGEATARHGSSVHAYCWMTNHLHLLVQVGEAPLGCTMHAIAMRYARRFQRAIPTTGHLFEHRYRARLVDADAYLLDVVRYIHLNPVAAGMVQRVEDYEWSSHCGYVGRPAVSWLTTGFVLAMFDEDPERARESYARFVSAGRDDALARNPDDDPERDIPSQAVPVSTCRVNNLALEVLIAEMCASAGVDASEVAWPSRDRVVSDLRARIASEAMRRGIAGMGEIAARMGRHPSSLTRLLQRRR